MNLPGNYIEGMPVVLNLHGFTESISFYRDYTKLHEVGDTAGFIVVYPEGMHRSWNTGTEYFPIRSPFPDVDDVGFISALIDTLYNKYKIDLTRVYCCGFSSGGDMVYRLACQLGGRIAAIAPVAGVLCDAAENWDPAKKMPVMHIHGTDDQWNLYYGWGSVPGIKISEKGWSVEKTLEYWINKNQCDTEGDTIDLPDLVSEDQCTAQKITFSANDPDSRVTHYKLIGGGHCWPGSTYSPGIWEGNRNMDFNASQEIWNFFKNHQNLSANIESNNGSASRLYPNPASDVFTIEISNAGNQRIDVEIFAASGSLVQKKEFYPDHSFFVEQINLPGASKGLFLVRITQGDFISTKKVILE